MLTTEVHDDAFASDMRLSREFPYKLVKSSLTADDSLPGIMSALIITFLSQTIENGRVLYVSRPDLEQLCRC